MKISGTANAQSVLNACAAEGVGPLVVDFSEVSFAQPIALASVAAQVEKARRDGRAVSFITSNNPNVANYISRMKLGELLTTLGATHNVKPVRANPLPDDLLELQKVTGNFAGEAVAEIVFNKLVESSADHQVCDAMHTAISETIANIEFHAAVDGGYVAVQTTFNGTKVTFAVADAGQGIRKSIEKVSVVNDDANALQLAVAPNVTGTGEVGRGQGLPDVIGTTTQLRGTVHVASGTAYSEFRRGTVLHNVLTHPFPGTIIQVELDCVPGS